MAQKLWTLKRATVHFRDNRDTEIKSNQIKSNQALFICQFLHKSIKFHNVKWPGDLKLEPTSIMPLGYGDDQLELCVTRKLFCSYRA